VHDHGLFAELWDGGVNTTFRGKGVDKTDIVTDVPHWLRDGSGNHDNELAGSVNTT